MRVRIPPPLLNIFEERALTYYRGNLEWVCPSRTVAAMYNNSTASEGYESHTAFRWWSTWWFGGWRDVGRTAVAWRRGRQQTAKEMKEQ